jgi:hypothetical protein
MVKILVLKPGKECIILRRATKNHICHECEKTIPKGVLYIEDRLTYLNTTREGRVYKKYVTNKICLLSWKGPIP